MTEKPVLLYTDAAFHWQGFTPVLTLAIYVFDPRSGRDWWSSLVVPREWYQYFASDQKTYIAQGELLAAVAAYETFPQILRGRRVMHFIDNTQALAAIVKGYAGQPDLATLVNAFHEAVLELRCYVWSEWVPSAA